MPSVELVLEHAAHAVARGAQVLAVLAGSGVTADAYDVARPEPSGAQQERALRLALERAGLAPGAVGHVNAHATSTPAGDVVEAGVLARTVPNAAVSATKSATGHLLGGAGGLEAVLTVMALQERCAPPTLLPAGAGRCWTTGPGPAPADDGGQHLLRLRRAQRRPGLHPPVAVLVQEPP